MAKTNRHNVKHAHPVRPEKALTPGQQQERALFEEDKKCPDCGSVHLVHDADRAEISCRRCGLVLEESMIDHTPERCAYSSEQRHGRARTGAPLNVTRHDKGISTEMGSKSEMFKVPAKKRAQYYRMQKWQRQSQTSESGQRNLSYALSELQRIVSCLGLPRNVHEYVAQLYKHAMQKGVVRGRSMETSIAALTYAACREYGTPHTLNEIEELSGVEKRKIGKAYRQFSRMLGFKVMPARPHDYIPRFASMLGLDDKVQVKAMEILRKSGIRGITSGKGPTGVAAAAIYIAAAMCEEPKGQFYIADTLGVTEVTIRNNCKQLAEKLGIREYMEKKMKIYAPHPGKGHRRTIVPYSHAV